MEIEEMKVYIDTLEKENAILKERNDRLYELNCNQARLLSASIGDVTKTYLGMVVSDNFNATKRVYNNIIASNTTSTTNINLTPILYI